MRASSTWQAPLEWPQAAPHAAQGERLLKAAVVLALVSITLLDRFGLRMGDNYSAPPALFALYAMVALVLATGGGFSPGAALAYLGMATVGAVSFVVNGTFGRDDVSATSFALFLVLYAPLLVSLRAGAAVPSLRRWVMQAYIGFALLLACAGIAQFCAQFVFSPAWLFDYTPLLPGPIRGSGVYNTANLMESGWYKSNGFFLREAAMLSIKMALAIVLELATARRKWVLAVLGTALLLTYSGSGLLVLAAALLFPLRARSLWQLAGIGALAAAAFVFLGDTLQLGYTVERVSEFRNDRASGYCRFVQPALVVMEEFNADPWSSMLGHGPGSMTLVRSTCAPTFAKVPVEYGLLGALALGALMLGALARSRAPVAVRVALGAEWLLQSALLAADVVLVIYLLSAMWPAAEVARPPGKETA